MQHSQSNRTSHSYQIQTQLHCSLVYFPTEIVAKAQKYFYPQLLKATEAIEVKKIIWSFYKFILPLFVLGAVLIYFSRFIIVKILFTEEFLPVSELFFWQLIGDVFGVCGLILGFLLIAQKRTLYYIIIEVLAIFFLYFSSLYCIKMFGIQGVLIAQCLETSVYLIVLLVFFRKYLF